MLIPTASSSPGRSIVTLSFTDENTKASQGHGVSEPEPMFSGSKFSIFSIALEISWAPALGSTEGREGILAGVEEKRGKV